MVLTILVFVHELGHFLVARTTMLRLKFFSIGFGAEIFGFFDKHGTVGNCKVYSIRRLVKDVSERAVATEGREKNVIFLLGRKRLFHFITSALGKGQQ